MKNYLIETKVDSAFSNETIHSFRLDGKSDDYRKGFCEALEAVGKTIHTIEIK